MDLKLKSVIFADVDDTVCESTRPISTEMAREVNRLIAAGKILAFISGSTVEHLWGQLGDALKGEYHLLGASGTRYVRVSKGKREEIYAYNLPEDERSRILLAVRMLALRHGVKSLTTEEDQIQDRGSQITFSAMGRHAPSDKKRAYDPDRKIRNRWAEELRLELGSAYSIGVGGTTSIDITRAGLDKGWGVREFLKFLAKSPTEAVFFGDNLAEGGNDYPAKAVVDCIEVSGTSDTLARLKQL